MEMQTSSALTLYLDAIASLDLRYEQGLVKGEKFCFRYLDFYFQHGESTSTASQLNSPASQKKSGYKQSFASFTRPWV